MNGPDAASPAEGARLDFIDYLHLLAAYGFTREQAAVMTAEKVTRLLGDAEAA